MSMNARLTDIRQRRDALVVRAKTQRQVLGTLVQPLQRTLAVADSGITIAREVRAHWFTLAAGTTLLTGMGRGRLGVWIGRVWIGWPLYRSLRNQGPRSRP
jgi:hypothetical protein